MQRGSNLAFLDSMRGLAAIIVVLSHFAGALYPNAIFGDRFPQHSPLEAAFHFPPLSNLLSGHFAVCLFFVLSGFVLSIGTLNRRILNSREDRLAERSRLIQAMIKRPIRLGGIVIASMVLAYGLQVSGSYFNPAVAALSHSESWFSSYWQSVPSLWEFLRDLLLRPFSSGMRYNPPLWTIRKELLGSYIVFFYLMFASRRGVKVRATLLVLLFLVFFKTLYVGFVIGVLLAEWLVAKRQQPFLHGWPSPIGPLGNRDRAASNRVTRLFQGVMLLLAIYLSGQMHYVRVNFTGAWKQLPHALLEFGTGSAAMLGAVLTFGLVLQSPRLQGWLSHSVLQYVGRISYALYALHFILVGSLSCFVYLRAEYSWGHHAAAALALSVTIMVLIPLAHLLSVTVDQWSMAFGNQLAAYVSKPFRSSPSRRWLSGAVFVDDCHEDQNKRGQSDQVNILVLVTGSTIEGGRDGQGHSSRS